ncbi:response regulator transcription factor [Paenibacillus oenotherae]|nr:LuxR C-terminal-related transcriptional regulator [Paenibacillus oenotherae]
MLLAMQYSKDLEAAIGRSSLRPGMYFTEESCGRNAVSEAMAQGGPVYLHPEQHGSPLFQTWHCFSTPLTYRSKNIGYLDVSTINEAMRTELVAITKLLPDHLLSSYRQQLVPEVKGSLSVQLTDRQLHILKLIAQGNTVKSIALELEIKESTVNHHKRAIFDKFGVQSSTEAVMKASRLSYL